MEKTMTEARDELYARLEMRPVEDSRAAAFEVEQEQLNARSDWMCGRANGRK
jgi:hypothetical protein